MKIKPRMVNLLRLGVLVAILAAAMWSHYQHIAVGQAVPSVHAVCPYGGLESLQTWLTTGGLVSKILSGTLTLFFVTLVLTLLLNRSFCGMLCPFGALQELFGLILPRKLTMPPRLDRVLRYLKYGVLALTTLLAWATATLWFSPYDPWAALAHISNPAELPLEFPIGTALLVLTVVGSLLFDRFFCKYLCPAGALYALIGKLSPYRVKRHEAACIDCGRCDRACPVNIRVSTAQEVRSAECLHCAKCVNACPRPAALRLQFASIVVKPLLALVLVVILFFGSLAVLDAAGLYNVSAVPQAGETIQLVDLKGWMSITEGAQYAGMSIEQFYQTMGIPRSVPATTPLRDVGQFVPGYDFHAVKAKGGVR